MKNILLLTVLSLTLIGCGSNNDSSDTSYDNVNNTLTTTAQVASIRCAGQPLAGPPPPPSECQEFTIFAENGTITMNGRNQSNFRLLMPKGYSATFNAVPNVGFSFEGWYSNGVKIDGLTFPFVTGEGNGVTVEAKMIPVAIQ
jgi:hypothetical protein